MIEGLQKQYLRRVMILVLPISILLLLRCMLLVRRAVRGAKLNVSWRKQWDTKNLSEFERRLDKMWFWKIKLLSISTSPRLACESATLPGCSPLWLSASSLVGLRPLQYSLYEDWLNSWNRVVSTLYISRKIVSNNQSNKHTYRTSPTFPKLRSSVFFEFRCWLSSVYCFWFYT